MIIWLSEIHTANCPMLMHTASLLLHNIGYILGLNLKVRLATSQVMFVWLVVSVLFKNKYKAKQYGTALS